MQNDVACLHWALGLWHWARGGFAGERGFHHQGSFQVLCSAGRGWPHHLALGFGAGRVLALQGGVAFALIFFQAPCSAIRGWLQQAHWVYHYLIRNSIDIANDQMLLCI